jgi:hypothetical protein
MQNSHSKHPHPSGDSDVLTLLIPVEPARRRETDLFCM